MYPTQLWGPKGIMYGEYFCGDPQSNPCLAFVWFAGIPEECELFTRMSAKHPERTQQIGANPMKIRKLGITFRALRYKLKKLDLE